jgi:deoxyadenosine/deoxycytidine kinase
MEPHYEDVVDNLLGWFYHGTLVFNLQIYFLNSRFRQVMQIRESGKKIIQDRMRIYLTCMRWA